MKQNKLLLVFTLLLPLYSCNITNKYKNVIIVIGDGMGLEHIKAANYYSENEYSFLKWNNTISDTRSLDDKGNPTIITDSAASGSAIATGTLTTNGKIGKDSSDKDLETILDYAKRLNKKTAIITTDVGYGATPSAFSAHNISRENYNEITMSQAYSNVDIIMSTKSLIYDDNQSLFEQNGYTYTKDINTIDKNKTSKLIYQYNSVESGGDIELVDTVKIAIDILSTNKKGYCLMIEQAYIDKYSHNNDFANMITAVESLNTTMTYLEKIAGNNTLIILTADHETGSLLTDENDYIAKYTFNDKTLSYKWGTTSHSYSSVGVFINRDFDFKTAPFYHSSDYIKNSDIAYIAKKLMK